VRDSRIWLAVVGVILLGVLGLSLERGGPVQTMPQPIPQSISHEGTIVWSHGRDGSYANAQEHWEKHGNEFPEDHSEADYVREANAFVHHPPPGTQIKRDARGDTLFYQPSTDVFAVMDEQGEPRTFFKPDNGMAYWSRQ
jgi:pyocin large subunit-like protein